MRVAGNAIACLNASDCGIFGVEMFLLANGTVFLNEIAPRPHNSGHYTIDGCVTSQFENFVRALMNYPIGDRSMTKGFAIMLNILGEDEGLEGERRAQALMDRAYSIEGCKVHWYDKATVKKKSKIGHINIVASSREECRSKLRLLSESAYFELVPPASLSSPSMFSGIKNAKVAIIMGSTSDLPTMKPAAIVLEDDFGVPTFLSVVSAHRTPERMMEFAKSAHLHGFKVIIAGAGGAAHLPGMVAACTPLPVIGVPVRPNNAHLDGVDALYSIVQMPKGVPVATVVCFFLFCFLLNVSVN